MPRFLLTVIVVCLSIVRYGLAHTTEQVKVVQLYPSFLLAKRRGGPPQVVGGTKMVRVQPPMAQASRCLTKQLGVRSE